MVALVVVKSIEIPYCKGIPFHAKQLPCPEKYWQRPGVLPDWRALATTSLHWDTINSPQIIVNGLYEPSQNGSFEKLAFQNVNRCK